MSAKVKFVVLVAALLFVLGLVLGFVGAPSWVGIVVAMVVVGVGTRYYLSRWGSARNSDEH